MMRRSKAQTTKGLQTNDEIENRQKLGDIFLARAKVSPSSFSEKENSVDMILSTEFPVIRYDWRIGEYIDEILLNEGARFRSEQIPLLDNHNIYEGCCSQIGSIRELVADKESVRGKSFFTSSDEVKPIVTRVKEGHLKESSIGYRILEKTIIKQGEKVTIKGKTFEAQKRTIFIVTDYEIFEASMTPIAANPEAGLRSESENKFKKKGEKIVEYLKRRDGTLVLDEKGNPIPVKDEKEALELLRKMGIDQEQKAPVDEKKIRKEVKESYKKRCQEITEDCKRSNISLDDTLSYLDSDKSADQVRKEIIDSLSKTRNPQLIDNSRNPEIVRDQADKCYEFVRNSLELRFGLEISEEQQKNATMGKSLLDLSKIMLQGRSSSDVYRMDNVAFGQEVFKRIEPVYRAVSPGPMVSSDFPTLLSNIAQKRLQRNFDDAQTTYQIWTIQESVPNFKVFEIPFISGIDSLAVIPDGDEPARATFSDGGESSKLVDRGREIVISWQTLINDDLGAIVRIVVKASQASARTANKICYQVLKQNKNLSDGVPLFHATHKNLGVPANLSYDELSLARAMQRKQVGPKQENLNLPIRHLLVSPDNEELAIKLSSDNVKPGGTNDEKNTFKGLNPVIDNELVGQEWYTATNPAQQETVQFTTLEGFEKPRIMEETRMASMARHYYVRFPCVALPVDFRGLTKNAGV